MTQGFSGFFHLGGGSRGEGAGCRVGADLGLRCVFFCLQIIM